MTDSEIIKALKWCSELRLCVDCPMRAEGYFSHTGNACRQALMKNALNLIIKQSEGCDFCKAGDEKCGTCKKMFEGMDGCSSNCDSEKCRVYEPVNYCFMCGRKLKGGAVWN